METGALPDSRTKGPSTSRSRCVHFALPKAPAPPARIMWYICNIAASKFLRLHEVYPHRYIILEIGTRAEHS